MRLNNTICLLLLLFSVQLSAHLPPNYPGKQHIVSAAHARNTCATSTSQIDQEINNVRAHLLGGGDCWWNFADGRYIVPKADPLKGEKEVSAFFAASIWMGGVDPAGNLKLAAQDYRPLGFTDYWPGPIDHTTGKTDEQTCKNWDKHFRVTGEEIRLHLQHLAMADFNPDHIPEGVKGWPARGNPYFTEMHQFSLPGDQQGLASFFDANGNGRYSPLDGDYPSIEVDGCPPDRYPAEMIFWIFNDEGGGAEHLRSGGNTIQMEVQVEAFGYKTNDEINDMTFQRYKLINRATELMDSTFFAIWLDPDLGCYSDDYMGCDSASGLMYVYNQDNMDGQPGCSCPDGQGGNVPTYCDHIPMIGVDVFRGPRKQINIYDWNNGGLIDTFTRLGMTKFMYYESASGIPAISNPNFPNEFYNYLTGSWKDGTPLTYGGRGYNLGSTNYTSFALPSPPNDPSGWSMCTAGLPYGDRRTIQSSGPFRLLPGAVDELIIGVPFVADVPGPCPDLEYLLRADKKAQRLFDNCFDMIGPDAPEVNWIELNHEIVAVLSNGDFSNNFNENYWQMDFLAPDSILRSPDPAVRATAAYRFEGYKIYQLIRPDVTASDFDNPDLARLVYQVDKKNGVGKIYNWEPTNDPAAPDDPFKKVYYPVEKVDGADEGIRHTFSIKEDMFSTANVRTLINHRKYYYAVLAYAWNEFAPFQQHGIHLAGQQSPYAESSIVSVQTVIPRPIVDQSLHAAYGEGVEITRLEGAGAGGHFLEIDAAQREAMLLPDYSGEVTYLPGKSPLNIIVFNPMEVKDGDFELELVDNDLNDNELATDAHWELRKKDNDGNYQPIVYSAKSISALNEEIIYELGISVSITQTAETGNFIPAKSDPFLLTPGPANGAVGATIEYGKTNPWLSAIADQESGLFNYIQTGKTEKDHLLDPEQQLSRMGDAYFVPYPLVSGTLPDGPITNTFPRMVTPAWTGKIAGTYYNDVAMGLSTPASPDVQYDLLRQLPNVDIVFTPDQSKWSRCVILETASGYYTATLPGVIKDSTLRTESGPDRERQSFDLRYGLSVGKTDSNNDGLPDPDNATEPDVIPDPVPGNPGQTRDNPIKGTPMRGMGWFPGYAVDVETGERLNIFFGENSCYSALLDPGFTGRDMLWNPTAQLVRTKGTIGDIADFLLGGQHWVYVSRTPYDECAYLRSRLNPDYWPSATKNLRKTDAVRQIAWAGLLTLQNGAVLRPFQNGLIPGETVVQLRVQNPFQVKVNTGKGHPKYRIRITGKSAQPLAQTEIPRMLDSIKIVPNPYFSSSVYETAPDERRVKITNLPPKCTVTVYSLNGQRIREFKQDERYSPYQQISPSIEWDLKDAQGVVVPSGVYLFHVQAYGQGERVLKWFGVI